MKYHKRVFAAVFIFITPLTAMERDIQEEHAEELDNVTRSAIHRIMEESLLEHAAMERDIQEMQQRKILQVLKNVQSWQESDFVNEPVDAAGINETDEDGDAALHYAAMRGWWFSANIIPALLKQGACINQRNKEKKTPLLVALTYQNSEIARVLIENGACVSLRDKNGNNALHWAAREGLPEIIPLLVEEKADINQQNDSGETPLMNAFRFLFFRSGKAVVEALLVAGANVHVVDKEGNSALHFAAREQSIDVISLLLEREADINQQNNKGETPLLCAIRTGDLATTQFLIDNGADIQKVDKEGNTSLHWAVFSASQEIISLLLAKKARINQRNNAWQTPLLWTLMPGGNQQKQQNMAMMLIQAGANVNMADGYFGTTPLVFAKAQEDGFVDVVSALLAKGASMIRLPEDDIKTLHEAVSKKSSKAIVSLLEDQGACIDEKNCFSETPLICAIKGGDSVCARLLIEKGADIQMADANGNTPLHYAITCCQKEVIALLLKNGASIDWKNEEEETPLLWALGSEAKQPAEAAMMLIEAGADIQMADANGNTPLHYAMTCCKKEVIALLLKNGASIDRKNKWEETPLLWALRSRAKQPAEAAMMLIEAGADINMFYPSGMTPLFVAVEKGLDDVVSLLLKKGANVNQQCKLGVPLNLNRQCKFMTPLLAAINHESLHMVQLLIENGADMESADERGYAALHYAVRYGPQYSDEIIRLLIEKGARLNQRDNWGRTPLLSAILNSFCINAGRSFVMDLITAGADVRAVDDKGNTALHYLAKVNFSEEEVAEKIIQLLIAKGVCITQQNMNGKTPLLKAIEYRNQTMARLLIKAGADISVVDPQDLATLMSCP